MTEDALAFPIQPNFFCLCTHTSPEKHIFKNISNVDERRRVVELRKCRTGKNVLGLRIRKKRQENGERKREREEKGVDSRSC